jgi:hypothetical protein
MRKKNTIGLLGIGVPVVIDSLCPKLDDNSVSASTSMLTIPRPSTISINSHLGHGNMLTLECIEKEHLRVEAYLLSSNLKSNMKDEVIICSQSLVPFILSWCFPSEKSLILNTLRVKSGG